MPPQWLTLPTLPKRQQRKLPAALRSVAGHIRPNPASPLANQQGSSLSEPRVSTAETKPQNTLGNSERALPQQGGSEPSEGQTPPKPTRNVRR